MRCTDIVNGLPPRDNRVEYSCIRTLLNYNFMFLIFRQVIPYDEAPVK